MQQAITTIPQSIKISADGVRMSSPFFMSALWLDANIANSCTLPSIIKKNGISDLFYTFFKQYPILKQYLLYNV